MRAILCLHLDQVGRSPYPGFDLEDCWQLSTLIWPFHTNGCILAGRGHSPREIFKPMISMTVQ